MIRSQVQGVEEWGLTEEAGSFTVEAQGECTSGYGGCGP